jgi:hypothetical protein
MVFTQTLDSDGAGTRPATTERYVYDGDNIALVFSGNTLKQRYLYVDKADEYWAGFANVVTGGLSNQIREAIYGSSVRCNQQGFVYNLGQVGGVRLT